jgi:Na+/H+ antiporter NhaA
MAAQTTWDLRQVAVPLRTFLRTKTSSAGVLVAAVVAALVWSNLAPASYEIVWGLPLSVRIGDLGVSLDLRTWINSGLMTLFFLVVGLEARREFDLGELRERRRFVLPATAGLVGMAIPVLGYLAITHGTGDSRGWGIAMSTDTALALGFLSLLGRSVPDRVRIFVLTMFVVDDLVALVVIATVYSESIAWLPLAVAVAVFALFLVALSVGINQSAAYVLMGVIIWLAMLKSGVDPVVAGLAIGLAGSAYAPTRDRLESATSLFRRFREEPTAEFARTAAVGLTSTLSPNARLQRVYLPWTSYVIVPLFALANAGLVIDPELLRRSLTAPITVGIVVGYVVGKPLGVLGASWALTRLSRDRFRPPVGWVAVAGSGTIAGTAFTVSLLIAALVFRGDALAEAKVGILAAALLSVAVTAVVFRVTALLSPARRARALLGPDDQLVDLAVEVDLDCDHIRGRRDAPITVVEYGDFECPHCGAAEPGVRADFRNSDDVVFVWRHLPLTDVHPAAQLAAEASEAAAVQDAFWPMHDLLLDRQDKLSYRDLLSYADELGLDHDRFQADLSQHVYAGRVANDVESADLSRVSGTPTFFINGRRHYGAYDLDSLRAAVRVAKIQRATDPR